MMNDEITGDVGWLEHGTRREMFRPSPIYYLALFVTILLGVAGGILLANWITASMAQAPAGSFAGRAGHVASKVGSELRTVYQHVTGKAAAEQGAGEEGLRTSRASSETGRKLARQCEDWRRAYAQGHSQTARAEMEKSCLGYEAYLDTGVASP